MAKGFFTQGIVILLRREIDIDQLNNYLEAYKIVKKIAPSENWEFSGPSLLVEYRPEVNGYASIDVAGCKWPDYVVDPKKAIGASQSEIGTSEISACFGLTASFRD